MHENELPLEWIIKIEPEEFGKTVLDHGDCKSSDDILRSKANIVADPIVILERLKIEEITEFGTEPCQRKSVFSVEVDAFAREGNEGSKKNDPHTCCFCQNIFSRRRNLKRHLEAVHCKSAKMFCDLCPKFFSIRERVIQHMQFVHAEKRFTCIVCGTKTVTKSRLKQHELSHADKNDGTINCFTEPHPKQSVFSTTVDALSKKGNATLRQIDPHTCFLCQKVFSRRNHLKRHLEAVHSKSKKLFCDLCPKFYFLKEQVIKHMKAVHNEKSFVCKICGFKTARKFVLKKHKLTHIAKVKTKTDLLKKKVQEKYMHSAEVEALAKKGNEGLRDQDPHTCCICKKVLSRRGHLKTHLKFVRCRTNHHESKMFCDLCPKFFFARQNLVGHIKFVHAEKRFTCEVCGYKTATKSNLTKHKSTHGPKFAIPTSILRKECQNEAFLSETINDLVEIGNEDFRCKDVPVFQKIIPTRDIVKIHLKTVDCRSTKLFCDLCPKFYFARRQLVRHMRIVHGDKKFSCDVCGFKTAVKSRLGSHKLTHSDKKDIPTKVYALSKKGNEVLRQVNPYTCSRCQKVFSRRNDLKRHLESVHCRTDHHVSKMSCDLCPKFFFKRQNVVSHMKVVHGIKRYTSNDCGLNTASKSCLKGHKQSDAKKLERTTDCSTEQQQNKSEFSKTIDALAKEGNEGLKKNDSHTCCFCQKIFSRRRNLKRHLEAVHCKSAKMFCDLCPKFFSIREQVIKHLKFVHGEKRFICNVCGFKTVTKSGLKQHELTHGPKVEISTDFSTEQLQAKVCSETVIGSETLVKKGNEGLQKVDPHTCSLCQKVFSRRDHLKRHLNSVHCKSTKMFCDLCPKFFLARYQVIKHMDLVHGSKKFACKVCDFKTATKFLFKMHKLSHTEKSAFSASVDALAKKGNEGLKKTDPHTCCLCQKVISKRDNLKTHLEAVHPVQCKSTKKFCDLCPRFFFARQNLVSHMKVVHGEKRFTCEVCGYKTAKKTNLTTHKQTHSVKVEMPKLQVKPEYSETFLDAGNEGLRWKEPHTCCFCQKSISTRDALERHLKIAHCRSETLICELCSKIFFARRQLVRHMLLFHTEKKFACNRCDFRTAAKSQLETHKLSHAKVECPICKKQVSSLIRHNRAHEPKESCLICQKLISKCNMKLHMKVHERREKC